MASTESLRRTIDFTRTRTRMIPLLNVGGIPNQPGLDLCNDVLQTLLSTPNNWKFNQAQLPAFTTIGFQQDYWLSGCTAIVAGKTCLHLNSALGDPPGLQQNRHEVCASFNRFAPHGIQGRAPSPAHVFLAGDEVEIRGAGADPYNGRHRITHAWRTGFSFELCETGLAPDGGQGLNEIGWLEHANLEEWISNAYIRPSHDIETAFSLPLISEIATPVKVARQMDNVQQCGSKLITEIMIRCWPVPGNQTWRVYIFYQRKAPLKYDLDDNWSPWPDHLGYVLRSGLYAKALDHAEDPRAPMFDAKFQADIAKALNITQQEPRAEAFYPDRPIMLGG